jgi:mRNA interferase MazF
MYKDFDKWNTLKKKVEETEVEIFANKREVWWSHLGINIGSEVCGKNNPFERPVLVLKVFSKNLILVAPLSTKKKATLNHIEVRVGENISYLMVEHIKTISTKRLSRKISRVEKEIFVNIYKKYKDLL